MLLFHTFGGGVVLIEQTNVTATTNVKLNQICASWHWVILATLSNAAIAIILVETDNLVKLIKYMYIQRQNYVSDIEPIVTGVVLLSGLQT